MTSVLSNKLCEVFELKAPVTREEICDKIQMQWMKYQAEEIKDDWFKKCIDDEGSVYSNSQSYWPQALQECGLEPARMRSTYKRIDHFWFKVDSIKNDHGIAQ